MGWLFPSCSCTCEGWDGLDWLFPSCSCTCEGWAGLALSTLLVHMRGTGWTGVFHPARENPIALQSNSFGTMPFIFCIAQLYILPNIDRVSIILWLTSACPSDLPCQVCH